VFSSSDSNFLYAFFFKLSFLAYTTLCAISQSTFFAVSYSGSLDRMLHRMKLDDSSATYSRKGAVIYTSVAWALVLVNVAFTLYLVFFSGGYMDVMLAPITTHVNLSDLLLARILLSLCRLYLIAAWVFPHAMSFMLAIIFTHQYKGLTKSLDVMLTESNQRRLSDWDIETLRQRHQEISVSVSDTDDFLMFHNAGTFCGQLIKSILLFYDLVFFREKNDPLVLIVRVLWIISSLVGLIVTTAGGIMVNHYVSTHGVCSMCLKLNRLVGRVDLI